MCEHHDVLVENTTKGDCFHLRRCKRLTGSRLEGLQGLSESGLWAALVLHAAVLYAAVVLNAVVLNAAVVLQHCDKLFKLLQQRKRKQALMLLSVMQQHVPSPDRISEAKFCQCRNRHLEPKLVWREHSSLLVAFSILNPTTLDPRPLPGVPKHLCPTTKQLLAFGEHSCLARLLNKSR